LLHCVLLVRGIVQGLQSALTRMRHAVNKADAVADQAGAKV